MKYAVTFCIPRKENDEIIWVNRRWIHVYEGSVSRDGAMTVTKAKKVSPHKERLLLVTVESDSPIYLALHLGPGIDPTRH